MDRQLQALQMLGVLDVDESERDRQDRIVWRYRLAPGIRPDVLDPPVPDLLVNGGKGDEEGRL